MYDRAQVPESIVSGINSYVKHHTPPGSFLRAVLENNLMNAFDRADHNNTAAMQHIVGYMYNEVSAVIWGDKKTVDAWIDHRFHKEEADEDCQFCTGEEFR